jgi:Methylamine utilisation protein MauE
MAKAVRPADTARALGALVPVPFPWLRGVVRVGSMAEAALGVVAIALPRPGPAWLVALSYVGFAVIVAAARSKGAAISSCGCFGTPDTPATMLHVVVNLALAGAAATVALAGASGTIASVLSQQPLHGLPVVAVSALGAWLTYLALSGLARVQAARRLTAISFRVER